MIIDLPGLIEKLRLMFQKPKQIKLNFPKIFTFYTGKEFKRVQYQIDFEFKSDTEQHKQLDLFERQEDEKNRK